MLYDVNGFSGDSGAGVFDQSNRLTGVISYLTIRYSFSMMGGYAMNFTPEQLRYAGIGETVDQYATAMLSTGKTKTLIADKDGNIVDKDGGIVDKKENPLKFK